MLNPVLKNQRQLSNKLKKESSVSKILGDDIIVNLEFENTKQGSKVNLDANQQSSSTIGLRESSQQLRSKHGRDYSSRDSPLKGPHGQGSDIKPRT